MNLKVSEYFTRIVSGLDENINLAEANLRIALLSDPELDLAPYLGKLEDMALELAATLETSLSLETRIVALNRYLFEKIGLKGNWRNFNDPRNSFVNQVLDRKLGIPISLALIYVEIGKRIGLRVHGVSFPGHFLVKVESDEERFILDPFAGGLILSSDDLEDRLSQFSPSQRAGWQYGVLKNASNLEFISRTLRNLKYFYGDAEDNQNALNILNLQLILEPESAEFIRERAYLYESLDCFRAAQNDFKHYLEINPQASDYQLIAARLEQLEQSVSRLH